MNDDRGDVGPLSIDGKVSAAELAERMGRTAFQARNLGQAVRIWQEMLAAPGTVVCFGLAGAMVPAGMRPLIVHLIENRLIDVIVSTGANLYHDVYESLGHRHFQTSPDDDDIHLARLRLVRFYDVLAPEHEFAIGERFITEFSFTLDGTRPYTTREYFGLLGRALAPVAREKGIVTAAAEHGVPIYCPALGDSVHGLAIAEGRLRTGHRITFDIVGDVLELAHIALTAKATGVVYVGGGTPK
ncbi:MAG: deoxyhypusine synthase family protein, partial [Dehalococcoidia bacterium]